MREMSSPRASRRSLASAVVLRSFLLLLVVATGLAGAEPTDPSRYDRALEAYRATRYAEAINALTGESPLQAGESNLLGWACLQAGRYDEAVAAFEASLALEPDLFDSYCGIGFTHFRAGDLDRSVENFKRAQIVDPGPECRLGYANALAAVGQADRAERLRAESVAREAAAAPVASEGPAPQFVARGKYFWRRSGETPFETVYVKGVNLSFARPGKHMTEFPRSTGIYAEWFRLVREMNANVIRVYTILPPEFYQALSRFNHGKEDAERLLLVQGIWADLPEAYRFRDAVYLEETRTEIRRAIDVVHGKAEIPHRYGHAHGVYRADVSRDVLAFIFGREWEPSAVAGFHAIDDRASFEGDYFRLAAGNPMEVWLTEMLDHLVAHEQTTFGVQRPVAWMNWPTLDPLHHPAEATFQESLVFRRATGEKEIGVPPADEIYDDDGMTVDETGVVPTPAFHAGLFASHHVYPYYPDFMRNEPGYGEEAGGRYRAYLKQLKGHYDGMPLLVSEYGVPTSRGIGRFHPDGLDHGGHSEAAQAAALARMTADIRAADCAGGIVFSWIDEWVKRNWMVAGTEDEDRRWFNAQDPEESYGLIAMAPAEQDKLRGDPAAWNASTLIEVRGGRAAAHPVGDDQDRARRFERLFADSDAGYLYLRIDVGGAIDWNETAYAIAIDTYGEKEGDHRWPLGLEATSERGIEFTLVLHGEQSRLLVDDRYNRTRYAEVLARIPGLSGWEFHDDYRLESNDDGVFSELMIPHGRKFGRDGTVYGERTYHAGLLRHGSLEQTSAADWLYTPDRNMIEVRIPWGLLHFADPSRHEVFTGPETREATSGIRMTALSYVPQSTADSVARSRGDGPRFVDALPEFGTPMATYTWDEWEAPEHVSRPKRSYTAMQRVFADLDDTSAAWTPPGQFDFSGVIENHYDSMQAFLDLPAVRRTALPEGDDLYGRAMANLALGLVRGQRFHLLEAGYLLNVLAGATHDPQLQEAARVGRAYVRALESGTLDPGAPDAAERRKIEIRRQPPKGKRFETITLGESSIRLADGARVRTQVDRVTRDWLSGINFDGRPDGFDAARTVTWHEGARTLDLVSYADVEVAPVWGTRVRKIGDTWYAPDADGTYRFEVTADKVYGYPTTLFLDGHHAWLNDTHGISSLAWGATDADLVIGCGDHVGKADAAYDLASRGVDVYMPTDRYLYTLIGSDTPGTVLGSAPIRDTEQGAILGDQPVTFRVDEPIVVSDTEGRYPMQYYDAPRRYFEALEEYAGVEFNLTAVDIPEYGKAGVVVDRARYLGAQLIGIRVATDEEHDAVAAWLSEDPSRRAILFHSAVYPEGYRLFAEFPEQTSFGDVRPVFGKQPTVRNAALEGR